MTLPEYLAAAHVYHVRGGVDPAASCAAQIAHTDVEAARQHLMALRRRSHVARVQIAFLDRVLTAQEVKSQ